MASIHTSPWHWRAHHSQEETGQHPSQGKNKRHEWLEDFDEFFASTLAPLLISHLSRGVDPRYDATVAVVLGDVCKFFVIVTDDW